MSAQYMLPILLGVVVSFFIYKKTCTPDCPSKWNQFKLGETTLHLHHWLLSIVALPLVKQKFIRGLLIGSTIHGIISYDDWYRIIY
jgi:hypothetical protein